MVSEMKSCPWERIAGFDGWREFEMFEAWMRAQIADGSVEERLVAKPYNNISGFQERWFVHKPSSQVWRLVRPDPPFAGMFEEVI